MSENWSSALRRFVEPLVSRVKGMIVRGLVRAVLDDKGLQQIRVQILGNNQMLVERLQQYGFTSFPPNGSEALCVAVGSNHDHLVALAVEDRTARPTGLAEGDVMLYSTQGSRVHLGQQGLVRVVASGSLVLECGSSSIVMTPGAMTITSPSIDLIKS